MDSLSNRITCSNAALSRTEFDDPYHPRRSTDSSSLSVETFHTETERRKENCREDIVSPDTTPKKRRTFKFVLSPVPQSPSSRRSAGHLGSPSSLITSHSESRGCDSGDCTEAGPLGYVSSPNYCQFSHALLTPVSETGSYLDLDSRSFSFSEPELSEGSDTTNEQSSLLPTDSSDSPNLVRIQSGETLFDSPALRILRESEVTLPNYNKTSLLSPAPVNSPALLIDTSSLNVHLAHLTSPYLHPPLGTFRSSHVSMLRSETHAEAREHAKRREARMWRERIRSEVMADEARRGSESSDAYASDSRTRADEDDEESDSHKDNYKDIFLGISELDIFGVGAHTHDIDSIQYSSSPWRRNARAPLRHRLSVPLQDSSRRSVASTE